MLVAIVAIVYFPSSRPRRRVQPRPISLKVRGSNLPQQTICPTLVRARSPGTGEAMTDRQRCWKRLRQRLARPGLRRRSRAIAIRHRRIWCELLEPRLVMAAPVAVNDSFPAFEDVPLSVNLPGVIANDTDADGDMLAARIV